MSVFAPERALASFVAADGTRRAVCLLEAADGATLVVDRAAADRSDDRLLARLDPAEPIVNAEIVCERYLAEPRVCRRLTGSDLERSPCDGSGVDCDPETEIRSADGARFRLGSAAGAPAQLRWLCGSGAAARVVSTRRVIGAVEDYEPVRSLSRAAVALHRGDRGIAITTLGCELKRLESSPIVLNRLLRRAVLDAIAAGLTMSAIALRCGRVKRDQRGNVSGETSWLARRIGLLSEGGGLKPTPWVHTDVLALIARRGLGIDPREVELG